MKKIVRLLPLVLALFGMTTSCNNSSSMGPKEVLVSFFERMAKKDLDGAAKLATKDSKATMDMMKKALDMGEKMKDEMKDQKQDDPVEEFKNMEVGDAKINGDNATVAVKNKKKNVEVEFPLKKEDGAWKVDFSMATLMKMGMDQREKQMETQGGDTSIDSVDMEKNAKLADSLAKAAIPKN